MDGGMGVRVTYQLSVGAFRKGGRNTVEVKGVILATIRRICKQKPESFTFTDISRFFFKNLGDENQRLARFGGAGGQIY